MWGNYDIPWDQVKNCGSRNIPSYPLIGEEP
jgi:hypothetical protein